MRQPALPFRLINVRCRTDRRAKHRQNPDAERPHETSHRPVTPLYARILLPTDGSSLSTRGAKAGVRLAKALGAQVAVVFVGMPYASTVYGDAAVFYAGPSLKEHKRFSAEVAKRAFAPVVLEAQRAGVDCATLLAVDSKPWQGILKTARARKSDAIVMASHGRSGLNRLFLGSETQRVLAHSRIPVLVIR
jgi:nucleotide-binding universal stress UspA family protein